MSRKFSRRCLGVALASLAFTGVVATVSASHSWGGYHWARTANPFLLKVGNNVSSAWTAAFRGAVSDWNGSDVVNMTEVSGLSNPKNCRGTTGRVEVCSSTYGNNGWLGLASISITGGTHITKGSVKLNDTYFNTSTYNTPAWRALVACQEVGHTLGLDHQDENFSNPNLDTCMDYTNSPDSNQDPNAHDYEELDIIYGHGDSTTTIGQGAAGSFAGDLDHNDPRSWGQLVKVSNGGRTAIYELNHGGGNKTVTFVIWALEAGNRPR
jgi:hypothetical protein